MGFPRPPSDEQVKRNPATFVGKLGLAALDQLLHPIYLSMQLEESKLRRPTEELAPKATIARAVGSQ